MFKWFLRLQELGIKSGGGLKDQSAPTLGIARPRGHTRHSLHWVQPRPAHSLPRRSPGTSEGCVDAGTGAAMQRRAMQHPRHYPLHSPARARCLPTRARLGAKTSRAPLEPTPPEGAQRGSRTRPGSHCQVFPRPKKWTGAASAPRLLAQGRMRPPRPAPALEPGQLAAPRRGAAARVSTASRRLYPPPVPEKVTGTTRVTRWRTSLPRSRGLGIACCSCGAAGAAELIRCPRHRHRSRGLKRAASVGAVRDVLEPRF